MWIPFFSRSNQFSFDPGTESSRFEIVVDQGYKGVHNEDRK
jgi:hypothetical protein